MTGSHVGQTVSVSRRESWYARGLVAAQFLLLGLWLTGRATIAQGTAALAVQAGGLVLAGWAFVTMSRAQRRLFRVSPDPTGHSELVQDGPYRWIRHPMYASILAVTLPPAIVEPSARSIAVVLVLALVLVAKLSFEERLLLRHFPGYAAYRSRSWRLVPFVF